MKLDATVIRGDSCRPAAVFIHGLGMDKRIWESPDESKILGGSFPISLLLNREPKTKEMETEEKAKIGMGFSLGDPAENLTTLFHTLREQKCTVVAWSQQRPSAGIEVAVSELKTVMSMCKEYSRSGIILIGHSRGGLVARKYLARGDKRVKALVTLATPHGGSRMAQWAEYVSPLASLIGALLPDSERGTVTYAVKRVVSFLGSRAVRELLPDSRFFRLLDDSPVRGVYYLTVGGIDPTLFSVYRRRIERIRDNDGRRFMAKPRKVFSVPEILEKVMPARLFPDELRREKGDGLVTAESSRLMWSDQHHDFALNHAALLFDERVKKVVVDTLNRL